MVEPFSHGSVRWIGLQEHNRWLAGERGRLVDFYLPAVWDGKAGGFGWLDSSGRLDVTRPKYVWINARMVHVFCLAHLAGRPGAGDLAGRGVGYLDRALRDREHGGWYWAAGDSEPVDTSKQAYGHAFVLLAASSAVQAGLPGAAALFDQASSVVIERFWDERAGLCVDSWDAGWKDLDPYRGQNANMHMAEAFMAAGEVSGDPAYLRRAASIAQRLIGDRPQRDDWRLPEHYDDQWKPLLHYNCDDRRNLFRPYGSTIGHWLEWSRLLVQLRHSRVGEDWMLVSARCLFDRAVSEGWDHRVGGLRFSVDWSGEGVDEDRYHWVAAEAIGAAATLSLATGDPGYEGWYQRLWDFVERCLVDRSDGSWHHQLDPHNDVSESVWSGKPDLYHAYQATLCATTPLGMGFAQALRSSMETRG